VGALVYGRCQLLAALQLIFLLFRSSKMQSNTHTNRPSFLIVDTLNGLFDGFYFDKDLAVNALYYWKRIASHYCLEMDLLIVRIDNQDIENGIPDDKFIANAWQQVINGKRASNERANTI